MKTILVIDDEPDVLDIIRSTLRAKAYEVRTAGGGEEGLEMAAAIQPDLIICDLMMPRVSGMEVVKRLKRNDALKNIPVLIISPVGGDSDKPAEFWARGLGVDDFVPKPFDPMELMGRVEYLLRRGEYVSMKPRRDPASEAAQAEAALGSLAPAEVVRRYVQAWNAQDWPTEYRLMADEIVGSLTMTEYIGRRHQAWQQDAPDAHEQHITRVLEEKISSNVAKVVAERQDFKGGAATLVKVTFMLRTTPRGWKILRFTEG